MLLTLDICINTIRAWKYLGMLLYVVKVAVGLIVIVTSTVTMGTVVAKGTPEAMTAAMKGIARKIAATILVFLVPSIITSAINLLTNSQNTDEFAACEACLKEPNTDVCNQYLLAYDKIEQEEIKKFEEEEIKGSIDTCDLGLSSGPSMDFSYKGNGKVRGRFSSNNLKIVEKHINDFNANNFHSYITSQGGFKNYTKKLGGIYAEYFGKTWKGESMTDLQEAAEYVFGYMTMYGFDYFNGRSYPAGKTQKYCKWGGSCLFYQELEAAQNEDPPRTLEYPSGTSDAFYPGNMHYDEHGLSDYTNFDRIIQGDNMTTNCNWTVDMVYWKAGIFKRGTRKDGTPEWQSCLQFDKIPKSGKIIEKICDLRVGDILHFYDQPVDHTNRSTWNGWKHVAFVGEIDTESGVVTVYDGGSYLTNNRNHKWTFKVKGNEWPAGLHGYAGWSAVRVKELKSY